MSYQNIIINIINFIIIIDFSNFIKLNFTNFIKLNFINFITNFINFINFITNFIITNFNLTFISNAIKILYKN